MSAGTEPVVELRGVGRTYGRPPTVALVDVSLVVERGELLAVVGPSGSGKSTLLNVLGTLDAPTSGHVLIDGVDVAAQSDRALSGLRAHRIGFVFQQFHLSEGVSAVDNVAGGLLYSGVPLRARRARAVTALERVGLGHRLGHEPNQLSGGERQRVAIARAVVHRPPLLLADEPTGNLDSRAGAGIVDLLHELHDEGTSVIVITHDVDLAASLPRRVTIRDGRIVDDSSSPQSPAAAAASPPASAAAHEPTTGARS
ncbi:ABC transporter ATP-binding protein [Frigoribacterium sp. PvP032]|uniref:ABC transporter ATP-binding protein n=1 Tax=Frigoribacterium sp. PvP032 TaxID=2806589 RepID=UPI001AE76B91|nr:ABC transporter ATP-binding protein [Frigoribacterium sp. PvP032]MBP1189046.1 putative ABC transport system ATP-binding protein [Frigoribacterium sp. PvP032]